MEEETAGRWLLLEWNGESEGAMKGEEWSGARTQRSGVKYRFTRLGVKEHSSVTSERVNRYAQVFNN